MIAINTAVQLIKKIAIGKLAGRLAMKVVTPPIVPIASREIRPIFEAHIIPNATEVIVPITAAALKKTFAFVEK